MARIENAKREELVNLFSSYIKSQQKLMGDKTNVQLNVSISNWIKGMGQNKKWSHTEIKIGDNQYIFKDREISEETFVHLLNKGLQASGVKGKVFYNVYGDGYWTPRDTYFDRLEIFNKPCKEFKELNKVLTKYGSKPIDDLDVFSVRVCGKRQSLSDCGKYYYLCHCPNTCLSIIDYIKANKGRFGVVKVKVEEYLNHGDEEDYRIAQYQESEWYGKRGNAITISIKGGKSKKDYEQKFKI